jgi:hypothetical protein
MSQVINPVCPDCKRAWPECQCNEEYEDRECGWPGCGCPMNDLCPEVEESIGLDICPDCGGELSWFEDSQNRLQSWCDECSW